MKNQKPTAIFSLEMGKLEIMMRLFSAEAGVALQNMRSGHMNDQDWRRLALRSSELAEAPLFIDDSPNLTMMEIRAKARRLRAAPRPAADRHRLPAADDAAASASNRASRRSRSSAAR